MQLKAARYVDELGRIVIPIGLRRTHDVDVGATVEMYTEGDAIVFRMYVPCCVLCGNPTRSRFKGKSVCNPCRIEIRTQL